MKRMEKFLEEGAGTKSRLILVGNYNIEVEEACKTTGTPLRMDKAREGFQVAFSEDQVRRILREKLRMNFSKPYPEDYRRQDNAEGIWKL